MERTSSWLISFFIVIFWVFRVLVAISVQSGSNLANFITFDFNLEIIMLFVTILSFILIVRRSIIGGILYFVTYDNTT